MSSHRSPGAGPWARIHHPPDHTPVTFIGDPLSILANGAMSKTTAEMAYQIDGGPLTVFPIDPPTGSWSLPTLTDADCPVTDAWYVLTVYAWDEDGNVGLAHSTFQRL